MMLRIAGCLPRGVSSLWAASTPQAELGPPATGYHYPTGTRLDSAACSVSEHSWPSGQGQ